MRHSLPTTLPLGMLAVLTASCAGKQDKAQNGPYNIVYIMTDDHTAQMMSCYDNRYIETPNLDRIANDGVLFTNSFVANSISGPSRACILTGKHSHINGFKDNSGKPFDGSQETFPKVLQRAGYQTAIFGKWHLHSLPTGFDTWEIVPAQGDYYNPSFITMKNDTVRNKGYITDLITDKSLAWLEKRDKKKPFCLMIHHKAIHRNWLPRLDDLKLYEDHTFPLPETFYDDYEGRPAAAAQEMEIGRHMDLMYDTKMYDPKGKTYLKGTYEMMLGRLTPEERARYDSVYVPMAKEFYSKHLSGKELAEFKFQRYMRDYAKVVHALDENVGRVLDYLEAHNLMDNTLVVYCSDQGFYMGEHGWFDKRFMYEESMHTPLVMHLPKGFSRKGKIDDLVQNIDFAPTFIELAGAKVPEEIQGESLMPLLRGEKLRSGRDCLYYHYYEFPAEHMVKRHYGVRDGRYKLMHFYNDIDQWELYDLEKDPHELHNVYADKQYAQVLKDMQQKLLKAQKQYADTVAMKLNNF